MPAQDIESCASCFRAAIVDDFVELCPHCAQVGLVLFGWKYYDPGFKKRPAKRVGRTSRRPNPLDTSWRADRLPQG